MLPGRVPLPPPLELPRGDAVARERRRAAVQRLAERQDGVLTFAQLYAAGLTRGDVRCELRAGRWRREGHSCVRVSDAGATSTWWRAVLETAPRAVLDGSSALAAVGLRGVTDRWVHVAVPKSARPRRSRGVVVHETRRLREEDVERSGLPRTRPAVAAVHAALWARSDREAALYLVAPVQQRLCTGEEVHAATEAVRRHARRGLLRAVVRDLVAGAESMGELDFAELCRRHGLPRPERQVVRRLPSGRVYLDVVWPQFRVTVEVDGVGHLDAAVAASDALKQNAETLRGHLVLRVPVIALRTEPLPFVRQLEAALRAGGWQRAA